jgi:threonine dehydrogenase-like Zn-dependent dehydrogenase
MDALAVFPATQEIKLVDVPEPTLASPAAVKVQMLEVGICGTDREIASFQYGTPPPGEQRLVIGHESLGRVVAVGAQVSHLALGDLVVIMVRRPCPDPECRPCRSGRPDFCATGRFTERGINGRDGFMTEFVVDEEPYLIPVPASLRDVGVLTEPLTIAEKALAQIWDIQQRLPWGGKRAGYRHRALVLGAGPVGLLGAMTLAAAGFHTSVYSREPAGSARAQLVKALGAEYFSASEVATADLPQRMGVIDVVYEATGASQAAFDLLEVLGANGLFVFTGVPGRKSEVQLNTDLIMRQMVLKNQVLLGTVNAGRESYEAAVRDLAVFKARWPEVLGALITGRHPLAAAPEALLAAPPGSIKEIVSLAA